jgi:hypothetical protein|eukprot:Tamp_09458.p3 GENE.Tamp_09458~~Tamp_09458.p3  ORF type:complete len:150 (-),score=15.76 Tamp_09458:560-1009(-)
MQACHEPSDTGGANLGLQHVRTFVEAAGIPAEFCVVSRGLDADASALTALATAGELVRATEHRGARCAARKDRGRGAMRGRGAGGSCALGELLTNPPLHTRYSGVLGCEEARIAKSILFMADGQPLLVAVHVWCLQAAVAVAVAVVLGA